MTREASFLGHEEIWKLHKTAFLCSRRVPAAQVLKCYDWAIAMRNAGKCVMLGAHSQLEKDVLHYLLKGDQPVVLVLARGMRVELAPDLKVEVGRGRLLLVAPFPTWVKRVSSSTAMLRNRFIVEQAQEIVIGMVSPSGQLAELLANAKRVYSVL